MEPSESVRSLALARMFRWPLAVLLVCVGCNRFFLPKSPQTEDGAYLVHVVSGGESREDIGTILLWYTGSEDSISGVQGANPGADLGALKPGQRIMIPSSLVTQTNPMPRRKFIFGVDVVPTPAAIVTPESRGVGRSGDPLEELMRRNERAPTNTTASPELQRAPLPTPPPASPPDPSGAQPVPGVVVPKRERALPPPQLESFSDDEVGVLPVAPEGSKSEATSPGNPRAGRVAQSDGNVEIKNPGSRRQPQPEVFDEE
jgi:hypothetical protein